MDHNQIQTQRFIGFLAQDVEQAAKETGFDFQGIDVPRNEMEVYTLRYTDFIVPVVKAMQEQQQVIEAQKAMISELKKTNEAIMERLNILESKLPGLK